RPRGRHCSEAPRPPPQLAEDRARKQRRSHPRERAPGQYSSRSPACRPSPPRPCHPVAPSSKPTALSLYQLTTVRIRGTTCVPRAWYDSESEHTYGECERMGEETSRRGLRAIVHV